MMESNERLQTQAATLRNDPMNGSAAVNITLKIGGKENITTAIELRLDIHATNDEIHKLINLIEDIEKININALSIQKQDIETLTSKLGQLQALSCMHDFQKQITSSIHAFFQNTINAMPHHSIDPGNPGYQAHEEELHALDSVIKLMTRELAKAKLYLVKPLTVQPNSQEAERYSHGRAPLPPGLVSFFNSINNTDACKTQWERHFSNYSPRELSEYFKDKIIIETSAESNDLAICIDRRLEAFVNALAARTSQFGLRIMRDVLRRAQSPVSSPMGLHTYPVASTTLTIQLIAQLDKVLAHQSFNHHFKTFRQALKHGLQTYSQLIIKETILRDLETNLRYRPDTGENLQTLKDYINRCITRISHPLPEELLRSFNALSDTYRNAVTHSRQGNKRFFLNTLMEEIRQSPEKPYSECYQLTKDAESFRSPNFQNMLSKSNHFRFFAYPKHRFKDFIAALLQSDTDYELISSSPCRIDKV